MVQSFQNFNLLGLSSNEANKTTFTVLKHKEKEHVYYKVNMLLIYNYKIYFLPFF